MKSFACKYFCKEETLVSYARKICKNKQFSKNVQKIIIDTKTPSTQKGQWSKENEYQKE